MKAKREKNLDSAIQIGIPRSQWSFLTPDGIVKSIVECIYQTDLNLDNILNLHLLNPKPLSKVSNLRYSFVQRTPEQFLLLVHISPQHILIEKEGPSGNRSVTNTKFCFLGMHVLSWTLKLQVLLLYSQVLYQAYSPVSEKNQFVTQGNCSKSLFLGKETTLVLIFRDELVIPVQESLAFPPNGVLW